jgi:hypothetical protein
MNTMLEEFITEGGLVRPEYMRNQRWQRAKLRYEIVKQRQAKSRSRDQLREEREQAWDDAHQQYGYLQAAATPQTPAECPVCASIAASCPTKVLKTKPGKEVTWWERSGGLVTDYVLVSITPLQNVHERQRAQRAKGTPRLRGIIQESRKALTLSNAQRHTWELRYRTETAIRRKYSLSGQYHIPQEFWDKPISASLSRQSYQQAQDDEKRAARQARGNTTRPKPPRSALSYSECSDDIKPNQLELEQMWEVEKMESLERKARKIGEEVGYLYFVGDGADGLYEWREDFLRSDHQLVYRNDGLGSDKAKSESGSEEDEDSYKEMDVDE